MGNVEKLLNRTLSAKGFEDIMLVSTEGKIELTGARHEAEMGIDISAEVFLKKAGKDLFLLIYFITILATKIRCMLERSCFFSIFTGMLTFSCVMIEMHLKEIYRIWKIAKGWRDTGETYSCGSDKLTVSESSISERRRTGLRVDTVRVNEGFGYKRARH